MAAKTYFINLFLICLSLQVVAQTDELQLQDWTKKHEAKLLSDFELVAHVWFEKECLKLSANMEFNKIKQCKLFKSQHINAYIFNNGHVYFSTAILKLINNRHQWAAILAHENAHIELNHYLKTLKKINQPGLFFPKTRIKKLLRKHEQQADSWAEKKLQEFNFEHEQIYYFLKRVAANKITAKTSTHLKTSSRLIPTTSPEIINQQVKNEFRSILEYSLDYINKDK